MRKGNLELLNYRHIAIGVEAVAIRLETIARVGERTGRVQQIAGNAFFQLRIGVLMRGIGLTMYQPAKKNMQK